MAPEDLDNEIKLIFAKACAEGLKAEAAEILAIKDISERERTAKAYGEAFSSAFIFVSRYFTGQAVPTQISQASAHTAQSSSTREAASQANEASLCPELLSLLKTQTSILERIAQLSTR